MSLMSEVSVINQGEEEPRLELPPGFRFHPTDEEVVSHYLTPKALDHLFSCVVIADVDLNKCEPWDLPSKAKMGEKEWYFFCHKDRKYPTGMRTNRATERGYWKATGKDKEIFRGRGVLVGMRKTLVFYLGRAPRGEKTPWVMHEYRLEGKLPPHLPRSAQDEWAVCRVFNKDLAAKNGQMAPGGGAAAGGMVRSDSLASLSWLDGFFDTADLPPLIDQFVNLDEVVDFKGASTSGAASTTPPYMGYQAVKTEQAPPPPQVPYLHPAAMGDQAAIRGYCNDKASALLSPSRGGETGLAGADMSSSKQYLELDDLCPEYPLTDYSNMWKC